MPSYDRKTIITHYQQLIRALIPYEQQNRLLEGLNRFSRRLPKQVRQLIKDEVLRLSSLTDAPADNSAFAQFPVLKFTHLGVKMCLDKIGTEILKQESALYQNRYTVGVFESVTSSEVYQAQIKKAQYKTIVDAFAVDARSLNDREQDDNTSITPNFSVSSREFLNGRSCVLSAFSATSLTITTKRPHKLANGSEITFSLPPTLGLPAELSNQTYCLNTIGFNQATGLYESQFSLVAGEDETVVNTLERYVRSVIYSQPLQKEQEIQRAWQDLERDKILENSPWMPLFIKPKGKGHQPAMALMTHANHSHTDTDAFRARRNFNQLIQELLRFGEAYYFTGTLAGKTSQFQLAVTHRTLLDNGLFSTVLPTFSKSADFRCFHCRLEAIEQGDKLKALLIHGLGKSENSHLMALSHVLFSREITQSLRNLAGSDDQEVTSLSQSCLADTELWQIESVMEEELDRRSESRFRIEKEATVKVGLLKSYGGKLKDLSVKGLKIELESKICIKPHEWVKVTIPELKIKSEKYRVVEIDAQCRTLRLCCESMEHKNNVLEPILEANQAYFRMRDIAREQRRIHRFIWEIAVRCMPSVAVLCADSRFVLDRLKAVYCNEKSDDLYPYIAVGEVMPLHGFLADRSTDKPKSRLLEQIFRNKVTDTLVVHCVRKADKRLVYIAEDDYLYGALRQHIHNHLMQGKTDLAVTRLQVQKCRSGSRSLTKKRLAQLSKIDKTNCERLVVQQQAYTHILYLTNESSLHNELVKANIRAAKSDPQVHQASA